MLQRGANETEKNIQMMILISMLINSLLVARISYPPKVYSHFINPAQQWELIVLQFQQIVREVQQLEGIQVLEYAQRKLFNAIRFEKQALQRGKTIEHSM